MTSMVRRQGILGGIALVGAGVVVTLVVSRSGQPHREPGNPGSVSPHQTEVAALAPDTSHETGSTGDAVKAGTASTRPEQAWTLRGRLLRYPDPEALEPTLPVADALLRLTLSSHSESKPDFAPGDVRSRPDGRFEITGVPGKASYRLLVDADGCALWALSFELPDFEEPGTKELPDIRARRTGAARRAGEGAAGPALGRRNGERRSH